MKNLLERNIYDIKGNVLICGSCLPNMQYNCISMFRT